jgi:hypothetical protein
LIHQTSSLSWYDESPVLESLSLVSPASPSLKLVGKLVSLKPVSKVAIKKNILLAWSFLKFLSSEDKEDNQMVFTFEDMKDLSRVLDLSPWNINGTPLFLKYWDNVSTYLDIDFSTAAFWVQVHGLPLDMMSEKNARSIGSCLGDLLEIDEADSDQFYQKSFLRLRVQIKLMDPLVPGFFHRRPPKEPTWIQYKYERLSDFCYVCDRLGHLSFSCPVVPRPPDSGFYGPFLKASPPKVNCVNVLISSKPPSARLGSSSSFTTSGLKSGFQDSDIILPSTALSSLSSSVIPGLSSTVVSSHSNVIGKSSFTTPFNEKSYFVSKVTGPLTVSTSKLPLVTNLIELPASSHCPIPSPNFPKNTWPPVSSLFSITSSYSLNLTKPDSSLVSSLVSPAKYSPVPLSKKRFHPYHKPKDPSNHFYSPDLTFLKNPNLS